jgi:hypothetical protein
MKIQKTTSRILKLEVKRDPRSGAGDWHKEDIRDRYGELPISVEIKNQESLKLKEWWRDANDKASVGQAPIVVFPMDSEDLCIMRYTDLLNIVKEMFDWRLTAEDLTKPVQATSMKIVVDEAAGIPDEVFDELNKKIPATARVIKTPADAAAAVATLPGRRCRNGHIVPDGYDKCQWKGCPYSATYKKPKEAKK